MGEANSNNSNEWLLGQFLSMYSSSRHKLGRTLPLCLQTTVRSHRSDHASTQEVWKHDLLITSYTNRRSNQRDSYPMSYVLSLQRSPYYQLAAAGTVHHKKSFLIFPSSDGMSLTKLSQGGNNDVIYKLFPPRETLVSDIPAGYGNIKKLFTVYLCNVYFFSISTCQTASGKRQFAKNCQPGAQATSNIIEGWPHTPSCPKQMGDSGQ